MRSHKKLIESRKEIKIKIEELKLNKYEKSIKFQ